MGTHPLLILAAVAAVIVVLYLVTMRVFFKNSKALDKKIDYSKMKAWKDDED
jgi:hypothetical protein